MRRLISAESTPILDLATELLLHLGVNDPPISADRLLAGLNLRTEQLPLFDLERLSPSQLQTFNSLSPVRGLLSPSEGKIYVSDTISSRQYPWLIYHEAGHAFIEWHREVLYLDNDYQLSRRVIDQMEREANEFAAHIQFLGPRFTEEARGLPFGLDAAVKLAPHFDASFEAAIRRYVETTPRECICLVFKVVESNDGVRRLALHYFVKPVSSRQRWDFVFRRGERLSDSDPISVALNDGHFDGDRPWSDSYISPRDKMRYHRQAFCNGHHVFILVYKE